VYARRSVPYALRRRLDEFAFKKLDFAVVYTDRGN
jgi:hypothetical protein